MLPAGTVLDRYEILFEFARGGMGRVYMARQVGAHDVSRLVAIKQLDSRSTDPDTLQSFFREARIAARLNHPNVVQTHELGETAGSPFIVMQLVQGVSLGALLARLAERDERVAPDLAAWIVAQAALGLHAAHELTAEDGIALEVVHRDISPQNILLSFDGRPYVADFGIAKLALGDSATGSGVIKGKFSYMSPEQAQALALDRCSDIFSLGILLYEALTGDRLFAAKTPAEVVVQIVNGRVTPPKQVRPEISEGLSAIVLRCLEKVPSARFQSAAELAQALREDLRSRGSTVDELDLAQLLGKVFPGEQETLTDRIRKAWVRLDGERGARDTNGKARGAARAGAARALAVGAALAVLAGAVLLWARPWASAQAPEPAASLSQPAQQPQASPSQALPPQPEASASVSAALSAAPSSSEGKPRGRVPAARDAGAPPAPSAAPAASYKGVPFNAL